MENVLTVHSEMSLYNKYSHQDYLSPVQLPPYLWVGRQALWEWSGQSVCGNLSAVCSVSTFSKSLIERHESQENSRSSFKHLIKQYCLLSQCLRGYIILVRWEIESGERWITSIKIVWGLWLTSVRSWNTSVKMKPSVWDCHYRQILNLKVT